ncbi:hypothetical protein [Kitasatospora griseola]|uniref:hypothetical protein n=1 Tax=Kitasatospora griseola TaxID=2064 RepID=UPI0016713D7D|nr:hypothetical protein [Kitasatospora griseola]
MMRSFEGSSISASKTLLTGTSLISPYPLPGIGRMSAASMAVLVPPSDTMSSPGA